MITVQHNVHFKFKSPLHDGQVHTLMLWYNSSCCDILVWTKVEEQLFQELLPWLQILTNCYIKCGFFKRKQGPDKCL